MNDQRTVYQLLSEWEGGDELAFDAFQTPENVMQERLPSEIKLKLSPDQAAILERVLDRAARQQPDEYMDAYTVVHNAVTDHDPSNTDFLVNRSAAIKIMRAIKLTNDNIIKTNLGVRDALWGLRDMILATGGIQET